MLKKTNAPRTANGVGGKATGSMELFKVLAVQKDGLVVKFRASRNGGIFFMEATPQFVEQKNKSANFMAKSSGATMHEKFYFALMRPTSNPEHQFRKEQDILAAKVYPRNGTKTVDGFGELQKVALGGGFTIFARAETHKKDPFDENIVTTTPADEIVIGNARIIHDKEVVNKITNEKGSSWIEVIAEEGHPLDMESLFQSMRDISVSKRGSSLFIRLLDENGDNDMQTSVYPGKSLSEVEEDISSIRDLNLPVDRVVSWEVFPRIYLRSEFMTSVNGAPSKLDRLRRDASYTYALNLERTPIEAEAVVRGERRTGGEGFAIPMAVSLTMYKNEGTDGEWVPGSLRSVVPLSGELVHSKQLFMTPEQRERALLAGVSADAAPAVDTGVPEAATPVVAPAMSVSAADMDFGSDDVDFGSK